VFAWAIMGRDLSVWVCWASLVYRGGVGYLLGSVASGCALVHQFFYSTVLLFFCSSKIPFSGLFL